MLIAVVRVRIIQVAVQTRELCQLSKTTALPTTSMRLERYIEVTGCWILLDILCWRRTKVHSSDFQKFDFIFAMDRDNLRKYAGQSQGRTLYWQANSGDLQRLQQRTSGKAKVMLFGEFGGKKRAEEIDDPYYGGSDGFEIAYEQISRFSNNFLKETFPEIAWAPR